MNNKSVYVDRRKYRRFTFDCASFVSFKSPSAQLCRILDISRDGVSFFYYKSSQEDIYAMSELDLFIRDDYHYLESLPFQIAAEKEIVEDAYDIAQTKSRIGIQFNGLSRDKISRLDHIILDHTNNQVNDRRTGVERRTPIDRRMSNEIDQADNNRRSGTDRRMGLDRRSTFLNVCD